MYRRTTRLNRVLLGLVGLALLAAAAFLLARHYGVLGGLPATDRLYSRPQARWLHRHGWIWLSMAGGTVLVGLAALRWLLVQPRRDRIVTLRLDLLTAGEADEADDRAGRTTLAADALTDAIAEDVTTYPAAARASATLIGTLREPEIIVRVAARAGGDLPELQRLIATDALAAARAALGTTTTRAQVHLLIAGEGSDARMVH